MDPYLLDYVGWHVAGPTNFDGILARAAARRLPFATCDGVPASVWLKAQMMQESSGIPTARSPTGPVGLMQLAAGTARDLGVSDRLDPRQSIDAGARYLAWQWEQWGAWDRTCIQRLALGHTGYAEGLGTVLDVQRRTGAINWPDFEPFLSEQGRGYHPAIRGRIRRDA